MNVVLTKDVLNWTEITLRVLQEKYDENYKKYLATKSAKESSLLYRIFGLKYRANWLDNPWDWLNTEYHIKEVNELRLTATYNYGAGIDRMSLPQHPYWIRTGFYRWGAGWRTT